jgi:hypothetical protein
MFFSLQLLHVVSPLHFAFSARQLRQAYKNEMSMVSESRISYGWELALGVR